MRALITGCAVHPEGFNLHHKDNVRTNDALNNLELLAHGEHSRVTNKTHDRQFTCKYCGRYFSAGHGQHKEREHKYCGMGCYNAARRQVA